MFNSIKFKLVIWFLVVFSVFFTGMEIFLYTRLENLVVSLTDEHLKSETMMLANLMTVEEEHGQIEMELAELAMAASGVYAEKLSGHYYQIVASDGRVLVRSPSLSLGNATLPVMLGTPEPVYSTVIGPDNEEMRLVTQSFKFSIDTLTFQAAESFEETHKLLSSFRNIVLVIFPAVFLLCGFGVFIMAGWALRPLKAFTAKVGQTTEENLSDRIEERGVPAELKPLAHNFNTMLGRLEGSFSRQKQFLSDASHELRTPTSIIKSFCDVTLNKERSAADYKEAIRRVGDTVNRMCDIINRILVISRLDSKTIQFNPSRMDLMDLMKDVLKLMEPSSTSKGIRITIDGKGAVIRGDREGLTEVFTNIVENAIKYNKPDGSVDISVSEFGGRAVVTVEDTGIGIPGGETERIFDRFYRVDASRGVTVGSGLGLSIVKTIVEAHGGRIEVKSVLGKGTVFKVLLPANADGRSDTA